MGQPCPPWGDCSCQVFCQMLRWRGWGSLGDVCIHEVSLTVSKPTPIITPYVGVAKPFTRVAVDCDGVRLHKVIHRLAGLSARSILSPLQTVCIHRIMLVEKMFRSIRGYSLLSTTAAMTQSSRSPTARVDIQVAHGMAHTGSAAALDWLDASHCRRRRGDFRDPGRPPGTGAGPVGKLSRCCVTLAAPVEVWSATHTQARAYGQRRCTDSDTAFTVLAVSNLGDADPLIERSPTSISTSTETDAAARASARPSHQPPSPSPTKENSRSHTARCARARNCASVAPSTNAPPEP
jgi:hypothetical protein